MGSIALLKDALPRDIADPTSRKLLHLMRICGEQLAALVDDILDNARLGHPHTDQQQQQLELVPFSPADLLRDCLEIASLALTPKQKTALDLINDTESNGTLPYRLLGDPRRIRQLVVNLLQNAINHTAQGEVKLCCSGDLMMAEDNTSHCQMSISVRTGIGIPQGLRQHLFQHGPFIRDDPVCRGSGASLGGLYISRRLVDMMCGTFSFESTPESGSVLSVRLNLPVAAVHTPTSSSTSTATVHV